MAVGVVINEFLANNTNSLLDQDGARSDWIELYNTSASAVNLSNYYLTDNSGSPQQWQFPNVSIAAGEYMLVFASGKDRRVAGQELHTNFTLEDQGEYLALVNGTAVVSQYAPTFPAQSANVSYGLLHTVGTQEILIDDFGQIRVHVPTASLGTSWLANNPPSPAPPVFDDSGWTQGTSGVGFDTITSGVNYLPLIDVDVGGQMIGLQTSVYMRSVFSVANVSQLTTLTLRMRYDDGFIAWLNGEEVKRINFNQNETPVFTSVANGTHSDGEAIQFIDFPITEFLSVLQTGNNTLAIQGLNSGTGSSDLLFRPMLVGTRLADPTENYFTAPTPLAVNVASAPQVADTNFSVDRGFYDAPFQVAITTATAGAQIRYTLDGSVPTATTGTVYTSPITINTTRTLRAAAFKQGLAPSDVDTQTYIFLNHVVQQNGVGLQPVAPWGHVGPDWEVDPEIANNPQWSGTIKDDLKSISTVSLTMPWNDWFGSSGQGIYISGKSVERSVSFELFSADGSEDYQQNAAVEIQGGSSANERWKSDKLSLEVKFKAPYGPTKFEGSLFTNPILDAGATNRFDRFILDSVLNFAWNYGGGVEVPFQRDAAKYIQDQVVADMQNLMGGAAPHGRYVHLYLNGLYWGMYYLHEKPDESFAEEYLGGDKDDYDVLKHNASNVVQGTTAVANYAAMLNLVRQNMTVAANYNAVLQKLDVDAFIDYIIINHYAGNTDWSHHNWYATFNRVNPEGKWRFHSWDAEHVFKNATYVGAFDFNGDPSNETGSPQEIHKQLLLNSEYRLRFADHVQKHFFNGGVLTTANATALYAMRANQIDRAIVGESARWGDNRRSVPYTRNDWRATQDNLLATYFSSRSDFVVNQYLSRNLFSAVNAANYSQFGGTVNSGTQITLSKTASTPAGAQIFWTTDGSDPRFSPNFTTGNAVVTINAALQLKARVLSNGVWSAMTDATFLLTDPFSVRIVEMNYHPADHAGVVDADDIEWVELQNIGTAQVNLKNVKIDTGINYQFSPTVDKFLQPGERIVIARDRTIFQQVYGNSVHLATGAYTQRLDNSTDTVRLLGPLGEVLQTITYFDSGSWPGRSDGKGSTLEIVNPTGNPSDSENWRPSYEYAGTPGTAGLGAVNRVVVNEVLTHTDLPQVDAIELYNTTAAPINIGGWYLTDTHTNYQKFKIPLGTILGPGQYLVFTEADFNAAAPVGANISFALSSEGDDVYLLSAGAGGSLYYAFEDRVEFGATINGESLGRWLNGSGELFPMKSLTLGAANSGPRIGPVVISEIMYNPTAGNADLEFVELTNLTNQPVALSANYATVGDVSWKFDGITFAFPAGTVIPANGKLVVVHFNPTLPADLAKLNAFRAEYGIGAEVALVGPFTGALDNAGESIQLLRPDEPNPATPAVVPFVLIDDVDYGNTTPWPSPNPAMKQSLTRWTAALYGNDPANWNAAVANPGTSDLYAPKVTNVFVNGTGWSQAYRDYLAGLGLGSSQFGFAIPTGANQTANLTWGNINRISIQFDENVTIAQANLELEGALAGTIAFSGFTYDPVTHTGTWSLAAPLTADQLQLTLASNVVDAVSHPLDGEWLNNASSFASGDGLPGGNFVFDIHVSAVVPNVGRGDFNLDGATDLGDITAMLRALIDVASYQSTRGLNATDLKFIADLNGDQLITNLDLQALLNLIAANSGSGSLANESPAVQTGSISSVSVPPQAAPAIVAAPSSETSTAAFTSAIASTNKITTVSRRPPALVQSISLQAPRVASTPRPATLAQMLKLPTAAATITQQAAVDAAIGEWSMLRSRHLRWGPSPQAEQTSEEFFAAWY